MTGRPFALVALLAFGLTARAGTALAHEQPPTAAGVKDEAPAAPARASDKLGGHLLAHAGALLSIPFAKLDSSTNFSDRAGIGYGAAGDLGIGVSRYVAVAGWFEYQDFNEASRECACDATALGFGALVRYHLVQGVRFDPWLSLGAGYRRIELTNPGATYVGIDWLKFTLGGDWYAISQLGFGPYASVTLGTFTERPEDADAAVYGTVNFGLSLSCDAQGR